MIEPMTDAEVDASARDYYAAIADDKPIEPAKTKRRKGTSPTARTLAECTRRGWIAGVVERHIPFPKPMGTKIDLFGVIDLVVIVPPSDEVECTARDSRGFICSSSEHGSDNTCPQYDAEGGHRPVTPGAILAIQATASAAHHAHRRTKILAEPRAAAWVSAGGRLELWSWSPRVGRNKDGSKSARPRWTLRVETYAEMLAGVTG